MGLVDYSSTSASSSDSESRQPPTKRRRPNDSNNNNNNTGKHIQTKPVDDLPPLPDAFHDLYASSVRQSISDDPSLHHGRKRATPHVVGNWPSHVYVEWHPTTHEHALLTDLLNDIGRQLGDAHVLHGFLTSELNAPLPLHVSLSRPLSLTTSTKGEFLEQLTTSLRSFTPPSPAACHGSTLSSPSPSHRSPAPLSTAASASASTSSPSPSPSSHPAFTISPASLAFYKSPDSDRTFLVLRVASTARTGARTTTTTTTTSSSSSSSTAASTSTGTGTTSTPKTGANPELRDLLRRTNLIVASHGHQTLYAPRNNPTPDAEAAALVDHAFHISIAWTFRLPDEDACLRTYRVLHKTRFSALRALRIPVAAIKVKIGNVVTSIPLAPGGSAWRRAV